MRGLKLKFDSTIELNGHEVDVEVEATYHPSTPDVWYLRNGDPGYPGDPEEVEIESVRDASGKEIDLNQLSDDESQWLVSEAFYEAHEWEPDYT